jgi:hypothetical protein
MRLANQIIEASRDKRNPFQKDLLRFAEVLRQAMPFEIEARVGEAAYAIADSDLKRLIDARRFAKAPFRTCWFEWLGPCLGFGPNPPFLAEGTERPNRCGFLVETDESLQRGRLSWAWGLPSGVELSILALCFDWTDKPKVPPDMHRLGFAMRGESWSQHARDVIYSTSKHKLGDLPPEVAVEEELRFGTINNPYAEVAWQMIYQIMATQPDAARASVAAAYNDLTSEGAFAQALLVCLNSRNLLSVSPPEDLTKLNKARLKRGRPPLFSFSQVRLDLSKVAQRRNAAATGLGGMRAHLVRGHFKIRQSGVFWWSPFIRGDTNYGLVQRSGYTVSKSDEHSSTPI